MTSFGGGGAGGGGGWRARAVERRYGSNERRYESERRQRRGMRCPTVDDKEEKVSIKLVELSLH
jgi:hypothetical protein